jgi:DNA-binding NarL/FixJ family response regulator
MMSSSSDLRVLIVAADPLVRAGLAALLTGAPGCSVVGQRSDDADLLRELAVYQPDVVLWDMGWELLRAAADATALPLQGQGELRPHLEQLAEVREAGYAVVVLLADEAQAAMLWAAGVRCLLLRDINAERLVSALSAAVQGLVVLDEPLLSTLLPSSQLESPQVTHQITPRELDVLRLLAEGLPNKIIADRLQISEHTVKFHVNALMEKLQAQSRTEAVVRAMRFGVLPL